MRLPTFEAFESTSRAQGFDEVLERRWPAAALLDTHAHAFAVKALVVQGEIWLTVGGRTQHLRAVDAFELGRDIEHAERYGAEGATSWIARRHGAA